MYHNKSSISNLSIIFIIPSPTIQLQACGDGSVPDGTNCTARCRLPYNGTVTSAYCPEVRRADGLMGCLGVFWGKCPGETMVKTMRFIYGSSM